jgi:hypothetical protein
MRPRPNYNAGSMVRVESVPTSARVPWHPHESRPLRAGDVVRVYSIESSSDDWVVSFRGSDGSISGMFAYRCVPYGEPDLEAITQLIGVLLTL